MQCVALPPSADAAFEVLQERARGAELLALTVGDFSLLQLVNTESHGALTNHDTRVMSTSSSAVKCRPDAGLWWWRWSGIKSALDELVWHVRSAFSSPEAESVSPSARMLLIVAQPAWFPAGKRQMNCKRLFRKARNTVHCYTMMLYNIVCMIIYKSF